MLVKNIVDCVLKFLGNAELIDAINNDLELNESQKEELQTILMCVNMVNNIIATDYLKLKETITLENVSGKILFSDITNKKILDIVKICDTFGNSLKYKMDYDGVLTKKGKVVLTYAFFPNTMDINDELDFKIHINERIFTYGVLAEYYFFKGNFDDASIWDIRFKQALQTSIRKQGEIRLPKRGWF